MPKKKDDMTISDLARMTATEFAALRGEMADMETKLATKKELQSGFSLIMETLNPMRRDYNALHNDLAPRMNTVEARLTRVERKVTA
ncbi:MAG: hypothetical protein AAB375_03100 [Patescibacteria group bacterium]